MKINRLIATSKENKKNRFTRIDELNLPENTFMQDWLKGHENPLSIYPPSL